MPATRTVVTVTGPNVTHATSTRFAAARRPPARRETPRPSFSSRIGAAAIEPDTSSSRRHGQRGSGSPRNPQSRTALLDAVDPLVACARKLLGEAVEAGLLPYRKPQDAGSHLGRRHPFGDSRCGCADEPTGGKNVEGAGALADEMRRRLKPRRLRDTATREQRNPLGVEKPRGTLGRISRVRVLGEEDQEAAVELFVEGRKHERQRRVRHAGAGGQRPRERLKPLAAGELRNEGVKGCRDHANGGKPCPAGLS